MNYEITLPALIEKAGKIIGTDNSLHTIACIDIALDHAMSLRDEIYQLRQKFTAIELKHKELDKLDRDAEEAKAVLKEMGYEIKKKSDIEVTTEPEYFAQFWWMK